ncbi:2-hydroxyacid dehydrogenase [Streptomyces sp. NPDC086010]|uniref:2-hydroxyacid dehydrogenase n=1 Tax=Streptomyces sp. NPDC086010 TaxID=3365745 RepID=UPI0037D72BE6
MSRVTPPNSTSTGPRGGERALAWLPVPETEFEDLPDSLDYAHWDGRGEYPTDPARVSFYAPPITKDSAVILAPLPHMPRLRVLQALSAGVDYLLPHLGPEVVLCNARGVHDGSTAEMALTLTLAALRGIPDFVRNQAVGRWQEGVRPSLFGATVLIVGYGSIGAAIEERLLPFGCAVERVAGRARWSERGPVHSPSALGDLLPKADVVILSVPLTAGTHHLVDAGFLAAMKDDALLVNMARGAVVDTEALLTEVRTGRLRAALDVTDPEPLPVGHPLWTAPGVLVSPHAGAFTSAFLPQVKRLLSDQLHRLADGREPRNTVNALPAAS